MFILWAREIFSIILHFDRRVFFLFLAFIVNLIFRLILRLCTVTVLKIGKKIGHQSCVINKVSLLITLHLKLDTSSRPMERIIICVSGQFTFSPSLPSLWSFTGFYSGSYLAPYPLRTSGFTSSRG